MAWAALGKTLLKGATKKVATDKLLNRKKKKSKKNTSGKEMLGGTMNKERGEKREKGGALAVRPSMDLMPSVQDLDPISTTTGESDIIIIKKQVIQVKDILKDTHSAKQAERKAERKARQQVKRETREEKLEKEKPVKPKESKGLKTPKLGFGGSLLKYFSWLAFGVILNSLWSFLPQLMKIGKILSPVAKFIAGAVSNTFNFIVGFITAAYEGMDKVGDLIEKIGGEDARKKFDNFAKLFTQLMNGALIAAQAALLVALFRKPRKPPKTPKGQSPEWRKRLQRWWKKTRIGKFIRNQKAWRLQMMRKFQQSRAGKLLENLRPKNIGNWIRSGGPDRALQAGWKKIMNPPQIKTPGWLKNVGGFFKKRFFSAKDWIQSIPAKRKALFNKIGKSLSEFKTKQSAKWGARLKKLQNLKPQVAIDKLTQKIRPHIDTILNKNPTIKKIVTGLRPKNASKAIQGLLTKAANNPLLKKLINTLKANKGAAKGLGPVERIITALEAVIKYTAFGESPINAILTSLGGLLGYSAAFSAATAVPVLGQSGIFNFMAGMAGGYIGDEIAKVLLKQIAKTGLKDIPDPIMGAQDKKKGLPARPLVRDPDTPLGGWDTDGEQPTIKGTDDKSEGLNTQTSYSQDGMRVVENTDTYIQPIEV